MFKMSPCSVQKDMMRMKLEIGETRKKPQKMTKRTTRRKRTRFHMMNISQALIESLQLTRFGQVIHILMFSSDTYNFRILDPYFWWYYCI